MAFSKKSTYVRIDGWRGYSEPIYAVVGASDTGTGSDSPAPSNLVKGELGKVKSMLRQNGIKFKEVTGETTNVFCMKRYIIVDTEELSRAVELVAQYDVRENSDYLYAIDHRAEAQIPVQ